MEILSGLLIPFIGTSLGAAAVFFMKNALNVAVARALNGFAAGVMIAAGVWSLLIPAIDQSQSMGWLNFLPSCVGFWTGIFFLILIDRFIPCLPLENSAVNKQKGTLSGTAMMALAVTIHNIPEGMAVGVAYAGFMTGDITLGGAFALALGIAIQNFPEGAIISMPLHARGKSKTRAFCCGVLSGAVEPIFGGLTVLCAAAVIPAMPYLLSFAAGAMVYVVVRELIPESAQDDRSHTGVISFAAGFSLMMALDVALG